MHGNEAKEYIQLLHESGWLRQVDELTGSRGRKVHELGCVKGFNSSSVANGQVRITANVKAPGDRMVHGVLVFMSRQPDGQLIIAPNCSCPGNDVCVHVAAVMHRFVERHPMTAKGLQADPFKALEHLRKQVQGSNQERQYLACVLVPNERHEVTLQVVSSKRAVLEPRSYTYCNDRDLFDPGWAEQLRQKWMRNLLLVLQQLHTGDQQRSESVSLKPSAEAWADVLKQLLKWQILYWGGGVNPVLLHEGEGRCGSAGWQFDEKRECFETTWESDSPLEFFVPGAPPYYIDTKKRLCGKILTKMADDRSGLWLGGGRQPSDTLIASWNGAATSPGECFPDRPTQVVIDGRSVRPRCVFRLSHREIPRSTMRGVWSPVFQDQPIAELIFCYGDHEVPEFGKAFTLDDSRYQILRNDEAERESGELLDQFGLRPFAPSLPEQAQSPELDNVRWVGAWDNAASQSGWMTFMTEHLMKLEALDWQVEYADNFSMRFVRPDRWIQELREQRNRSWFEFELGVECDGERIDLIPVLTAYLEGQLGMERQLKLLGPDDKVPIQLEDGRYLAMPVKRLQPIIKILEDLIEELRGKRRDDDKPLLHSMIAAELLNESSDFTDAGSSTEVLQAVGRGLSGFKGIEEVPEPQGLQAELRDYQKTGFRWLQFLSQYRLGGILADDMGLGKTLQTIAHMLAEKVSGRLTKPVLIVAPTSLLGNWQEEIAKFAPALTVHIYYGPGRHRQRQAFDAADVIVTSYSLVFRDQESLETYCFSHLILDEAQNIKNPASRSSQSVCALDAENRLCISGTPIENHLEELWSLFHFLMPGFLGRQENFRQRFRHPIEKEGDTFARNLLASRVGPLMLRRKKTEVAKELPPKTEMIRSVELEGAQRDLYETIRAAMQDRVQEVIAEQGIERAHLYILDALLKLRQGCCHPRLLSLEAAQQVETSAKMEFLFEMLPEMIGEGRRVLLFSQFTTMLDLLEHRLGEVCISHVRLDGSTRNRDAVVKRFQRKEVPLFLISLKAGGVGLNLTQADTVIHYDPWWNPAVENQATDRAYRIGQDQPVFVYKLITKGSIEERIVAMQEDKKELVEGLLSEGVKHSMKFSKSDLQTLLQPLKNG